MTRLRFAAMAITVLAGVQLGHADPIATIITDRATIGLPPTVAITAIHLSPRLAALDVDPATVDVDFPAALAARPGRVSVRVRVAGKRGRTVFVPITLAAMAEVAVATRDLAPGTIVGADDVRWERRPVDAGVAAVVTLGAAVSAPIRAGELLDDARLTTPPAIARGTAVAVTVERGAISITSRGRLEQATRLGAAARVRLDGGGLTTGRLVAADRVRVEVP